MGRFIRTYLKEVKFLTTKLLKDITGVENLVDGLVKLREDRGRLFILGVGGSAANASHAVNDFRKTACIEAYTPSDNVSELTARINDNGWENSFVDWLKGSKLTGHDALLVLSVGGGDAERNISTNIIKAVDYAKSRSASVFGITGKVEGYTAKNADICIVIGAESIDRITAHTESFQSIIWHLLISHPKLKVNEMKWESLT
jgi:D-sedoheptulose 7-phosphate isomerase